MELAVTVLPPTLAGPELCSTVLGAQGFTLLMVCYYYSRETINFNFFFFPHPRGNRREIMIPNNS